MATKYTPKANLIPDLDIINTPNKYIQSYFMRSEISYYVPEKHRIHLYRTNEPIIHVILADKTLRINDLLLSIDLFDKTQVSKKFGCLEAAVCYLESIVRPALAKLSINAKTSFVSLAFQDGLSRIEIIYLVDCFLNGLLFRGILLLPYSLSLCLGMNVQNAVVINLYEDYSTVSFVDDYWLVDMITIGSMDEPWKSFDAEDFAEEYTRSKAADLKSILMCDMCDFSDESKKKVLEHIRLVHLERSRENAGLCKKTEAVLEEKSEATKKLKVGNAKDQQPDNSNNEASYEHLRHYIPLKYEVTCDTINRIKFLFLKDKVKKIGSRLIVFRHCQDPIYEVDDLEDRLKSLVGTVEIISDETINSAKFKNEDDAAIEGMDDNLEGYNELAWCKESASDADGVVPGEKVRSNEEWVSATDLAYNGIVWFSELEVAKDCWMTDKEWNSVRLRSLKEKVLFTL